MNIGGDIFDQNVMDYFLELIKYKYSIDLSNDRQFLQKLKIEVEKAKKALSFKTEARIEIKNIVENQDFNEILTRDKFEQLNIDLFKKTLNYIKIAIDDSLLKKSEINEILLVGGSSKIPKIRELVKNYFDGKELYDTSINIDEAVIKGAAIQGDIICGDQILFIYQRLTQQEIDDMINNADILPEIYQLTQERVDAKNNLDLFIKKVKKQVMDFEKQTGQFLYQDKQNIISIIKEYQEWLDNNPYAEKQEYEEKYKILQKVWDSFILKIKNNDQLK